MVSSKLIERFKSVYNNKPAALASAPGRIEFIGNHTDYNGGQVLGVAIDRRISIAAHPRSDRVVRLTSDGYDEIYEVTLDSIKKEKGQFSWVNYPLGVLKILMEDGLDVKQGFDMAIESTLPSGAGLSSSAAMELASLEIFSQLYGRSYSDKDKVLLSQKAENHFVGVPCGMLDQAVSCFGKKNQLVRIDCEKVEFTTVPMMEDLHFWIFNTNAKHSLVDSLYSTRHEECRKALSELNEAGVVTEHLATVEVDDLEKLDKTEDAYRRARHVLTENNRVYLCMEALDNKDLTTVGQLLFESHESSRKDFENSTPELDTFVKLLSEEQEMGIVGARLTGGGFGGAVMALATGKFDQARAKLVLERYKNEHPTAPAPSVLHVQTDDGVKREDFPS